MPPLRIVFLGSDPIALPLLNWLVGEGGPQVRLLAIFTQPDRAVGRGQKIVPNAIKAWALEKHFLVYQPEKLDDGALAQLKALSADVALVMAYGHILKDEFINTPRLGTLNLHASILPRYRGASPIQTAVANGEIETGVSLMRIVRRLDAGPVADVERVAIERYDTAREIEQKLSAACQPLLARNLESLTRGVLEFAVQDEAAATYCRRLVKEDGALDFQQPARVLARRINGLFPWPSCGAEIHGQMLKFGLAEERSRPTETPLALAPLHDVSSDGVSAVAAAPGTVLGYVDGALLIQTGEGVLGLLKLQRPGGRMLNAEEFLRGFAIEAGAVIASRTMPPLVAAAPFKS